MIDTKSPGLVNKDETNVNNDDIGKDSEIDNIAISSYTDKTANIYTNRNKVYTKTKNSIKTNSIKGTLLQMNNHIVYGGYNQDVSPSHLNLGESNTYRNKGNTKSKNSITMDYHIVDGG